MNCSVPYTLSIAVLLVAATMGRAAVQTPPTETPADDSSLPHGIRDMRDQRNHPTALELLKSLRRARPMAGVIEPTGAIRGDNDQPDALLLPQGATVVGRTGTLAQSGPWWTFVFDPANGEPPTKLLPNANLELMIRTAAGSSSRFPFLISGEMTVFEDENYMIIRAAQRVRSNETSAAPQSPNHATDNHAQPHNEPSGDANSDGTANGKLVADVSAEDALKAMANQNVEQIMALETQQFDQPDEGSGASNLLADGSPLVRRPGRIVRDGRWWTFVFESDHADHPELPLRLLPSAGTETMAQAHERVTTGLVFILSGEVTLFHNRNYVFPRFVTRRVDSGNLSE